MPPRRIECACFRAALHSIPSPVRWVTWLQRCIAKRQCQAHSWQLAYSSRLICPSCFALHLAKFLLTQSSFLTSSEVRYPCRFVSTLSKSRCVDESRCISFLPTSSE